MSSDKTKKLDVILEVLKRAAKFYDIPESLVTKAQFVKCIEDDEDIKEWDIRKLGGLTAIKNAHFPAEGKELADIRDFQKTKLYISRLERKLGDKLSFERELLSSVESRIKPLTPPKLSHLNVTTDQNNIKREVVAMLNDLHIGAIVDPGEIDGINAFDFKYCSRRLSFMTKEICEYKVDVRHQVGKLHLVLNGDIIAGIIHELESRTHDILTHQMNGAMYILTHMIEQLCTQYRQVVVHCTPGNHDRMIHKNKGKRPHAEVYDSYANILYYGLSVAFRKYPNVSFNVPKTSYGFIDLPGGRCMYTHGDTMFSSQINGSSKTLSVQSFSDAMHRFSAGEISKGKKKIDLLLMGHVHFFNHFITHDNVEIYIAPSLLGLDSFAHSLTINNNFAGQVIFESTPDFILGDSRLIRVNRGDKDKSLDKIIPIYKKELKWVA